MVCPEYVVAPPPWRRAFRSHRRVPCISPLSMSPALTRAYEQNPALEERLTRHIPVGRVGDPEHDIAPVVSFLLGAESSYLTGQTIVVDGGRFTTL